MPQCGTCSILVSQSLLPTVLEKEPQAKVPDYSAMLALYVHASIHVSLSANHITDIATLWVWIVGIAMAMSRLSAKKSIEQVTLLPQFP